MSLITHCRSIHPQSSLSVHEFPINPPSHNTSLTHTSSQQPLSILVFRRRFDVYWPVESTANTPCTSSQDPLYRPWYMQQVTPNTSYQHTNNTPSTHLINTLTQPANTPYQYAFYQNQYSLTTLITTHPLVPTTTGSSSAARLALASCVVQVPLPRFTLALLPHPLITPSHNTLSHSKRSALV